MISTAATLHAATELTFCSSEVAIEVNSSRSSVPVARGERGKVSSWFELHGTDERCGSVAWLTAAIDVERLKKFRR